MRKAIAISGLVLASTLFAACGGGSTQSASTSTAPSTTAPTTTAPVTTTTSGASLYQAFLALNTKLGGDAWTGSQSDAVTRAALDCSGTAKAMLGGMPISNYPTDVALIQTYCPSKMSLYK